MRKEVYTFQGYEFVRVNKTVARDYFNRGGVIYIAPCKANLYSSWVSPVSIRKEDADCYGYTFDDNISYFEYYACDGRLGHYAKFFILNLITD